MGQWVVETAMPNKAYKAIIKTVSYDRAVSVFNCYPVHSGGRRRMRLEYPDGSGYVAYREVTYKAGKGVDTFYTHPDFR